MVEHNYIELFMNRLETGDIICFEQTRPRHLFSRAIVCFTQSHVTHVGIVIKTNMKYFLLHALINETVMLEDLEEVIRSYEQCVVYQRRLYVRRDLAFYRNVSIFIERVKNKKYYFDVVQFIKAQLSITNKLTRSSEEINRFFCSSLVAYFLQTMNFLPLNLDVQLFTPKEIFNLNNDFLDTPKVLCAI